MEIKTVGSPSLDLIKKINFKARNELSKIYNFNANKDFILCTFHPVTNEISNTSKYINQLQSLKKASLQLFSHHRMQINRIHYYSADKKFVRKIKIHYI